MYYNSYLSWINNKKAGNVNNKNSVISNCLHSLYVLQARIAKKYIHYNFVGQISKRDTVSIYRNQNVFKTTNLPCNKECEKGVSCMSLQKTGGYQALNRRRNLLS